MTSSLALVVFLLCTASPAWADTVTFVSGTITDSEGNGVSDISVQMHTGNGEVNITDVTDGSGNYSIVGDDAEAIGESLSVEFNAPDGYMEPSTMPYLFTYQDGDAERTGVDFELITTSKTINVTVVTVDGAPVQYADVNAAPVDAVTTRSAGNVFEGGVGSLEVTGGRWVVVADRNLSEQDPERYPWIAIGGGQIVEFANDTTEESIDLTFEVVPSERLVQVHPVDDDGDDLTESSFNGDVAFTGYNKTYGSVSTQAKVNAETGIASMYLLPGVWKMEIFHNQQIDQQNLAYDPADLTFVVPDEPGTTDLGTIQAIEKTGTITGTVTEAAEVSGQMRTQDIGLNITVRATNLDTGDSGQGSTTSGGTFSIGNLGPGNYSVSVDHDGYIGTGSAHAVLVQGSMSATGLELEAIQSDMTVQGTVELDNTSVENLPASVVVEGDGMTFSAPVAADGSFEIEMFTAGISSDEVSVELVTQPGAEYYQDLDLTVPVQANSTQDVTLDVDDNESIMTGSIVDQVSGDGLTETELSDTAVVVAIDTATGATETATVDSNGDFELAVGPGEWQLMIETNGNEATALTSLVNNNTVTVTEGDDETNLEIETMVADSTVAGTITDPDGNVVPEAPLIVTNLAALEAAADAGDTTVDPADIISVSTTTDADGNFSLAVPAGDFVATVGGNPDTQDWTTPVAQEFTATAGDTTTVDSEYRDATATISGTLSDELQSGTVTLYSDQGGSVVLDVEDDGSFTGSVAPGDWSIISSGVKDGELWAGTDTVTITEGDNDAAITVSSTGLDFPAASTITGDADAALSLSTPDGVTVSLPAYSAALEGTVTLEVAPNPSLVYSGDVAQVGLSYDVTVRDDDGIPITQLDQPATVTLPLAEELTGGVDTEEIMPGYYVPEMDSYLYDGMVADVKADELVIHTTHFTRFSASTIGEDSLSLSSVSKPKAPKKLTVKKRKIHAALVHWNKGRKADTVRKYKVQVSKTIKKWKKSDRVIVVKKQKARKARQVWVRELKADTQYRFRVKACNASGCSKYSKWEKFTTKAKQDS